MILGRAQIDKIHQRLERLENAQADIREMWDREKIEFADLYDRVYRILKRFEMRERRAEEPDRPTEAPPCEEDPVTARVLARREARRHVSA